MKLDKTNVCVFIENEAQLQQAREVLEMYGEETDKYLNDWIESDPDNKYFCYSVEDNNWWICSISRNVRHLTQITLTELEEILKGEKDERV